MTPYQRIISKYPYLSVNTVTIPTGSTPGRWRYNKELNLIEFIPYKESDMDEQKASTAQGLEQFVDLMNNELLKGDKKYGEGDTTLEFVRGINPQFELGAIAKYISRIAHGDSRSETDVIKVATYAFLWWARHSRSPF